MRKNQKSAGRPEFQPTAELRRQVAIAAGGGMSHEEMAIALDISRNTLEKHFAFELSQGAYKKRFEVLQALHRAAKKGSVSAIKAYTALTPRAAAPPVPKQPAPEPEARAVPLGKKEQAQADAATAATGTEWETILNRRQPLQ